MLSILAVLLAADPSSGELIRSSADAVLAEPAPAEPPAARNDWDFSTKPQYVDLVTARYPLAPAEQERLFSRGFVVAARLRQTSFQQTFHDLHEAQLPLFVSTDSVLHAVFRSHEEFLVDAETRVLGPRLMKLLRELHQALPQARASWPKAVGDNVDAYLRVARIIGLDDNVTPTKAESALVARIRRARSVEDVVLFGRRRRVDFTLFQPRGHYVKPKLEAYFRVVTWLSRVEFNLKSNACASSHPGPGVLADETPLEVLTALALAELAERAAVAADLETIDRLMARLAGRREDVSPGKLGALRRELGIDSLLDDGAAAKVTAALATFPERTVNFHPMPSDQVVRPLPVIATLLGPRITADATALGPLRFQMSAEGWGVLLGHPRARDFVTFAPEDDADAARKQLEDGARALASVKAGDDLYSNWLAALLEHGKGAPGVYPTFIRTQAWADFRLNTALVGYAQLRHNSVLYAAQPVLEGGCRIPDSYVEPSVGTYEALVGFARSGAAMAAELDSLGNRQPAAREYFEKLERTLKVLAAISRQELANQPLSAEAQRFLSMVVETWAVRNNYGLLSAAQRDGWYFDLLFDYPMRFSQEVTGASVAVTGFIADVHATGERVMYVGAREPELGFFVVDTGGPPRLMVGPVARGFATNSPRRSGRFADADLADDAEQVRFKSAAWSESYRVDPGPRRLRANDYDSRWYWAVNSIVSQKFQPTGTVEFGDRPVKGVIRVRVLGEHGEELFSGTAPQGRFTVPPELRTTCRRLVFEAEGEVIEASTSARLPAKR